MQTFLLPPDFYTPGGRPGGEPRQRHLVSEGWRMEAGEAQTGIRHPWNIRSVFWLQTSQNVRVGGRLPELSAGDAQEDAKTRWERRLTRAR